MEQPNTNPERMREIEIFGVPALYSSTPIDPEDLYPGMSLYELQGQDGKFLASVLTPVPIPVLADGPRDLKPGELVMDTGAGYYTPPSLRKSTCPRTTAAGPARSGMEKKVRRAYL